MTEIKHLQEMNLSTYVMDSQQVSDYVENRFVHKDGTRDSGSIVFPVSDGNYIGSTVLSNGFINIESETKIDNDTPRYYQSIQHGWKVSADGPCSFAHGKDTRSSGNYSVAFGGGSFAKGDRSFAIGHDTSALGTCSFAEGEQCVAGRNYSHAEGYHTRTMSGLYDDGSHSEGFWTEVWGSRSHAEGEHTITRGTASHSEGGHTLAEGNHSHSEGQKTQAIGSASHSEGNMTIAYGEVSKTCGFLAKSAKNCTYTSTMLSCNKGDILKWTDSDGWVKATEEEKDSNKCKKDIEIKPKGYQGTDLNLWSNNEYNIVSGESGKNLINGKFYKLSNDSVQTKLFTMKITVNGTKYDKSFVWNGNELQSGHNSEKGDVMYGSNGKGTFNVNPQGGIRGFYIGEMNFVSCVFEAIKNMSYDQKIIIKRELSCNN